MDSPLFTQLNIEISTNDAKEEAIERFPRRLLSEFRETDIDSPELVSRSDAPRETKSGDQLTPGSIAIDVLPVILPRVIRLVEAQASNA